MKGLRVPKGVQLVIIAYPATVEGWLEYIAGDPTLARKVIRLIMQKQPNILRPSMGHSK
jgi:hypothetical protein